MITPKELISKLQKLPQDLPIWIGVDSGEGYLPFEQVFVANTIALPLDLDCASGRELEYFDDENPKPEIQSGWIVDGDCIYKEVIILGTDDAWEDYWASLNEHINQDALEKERVAEQIAYHEKQIKLLRNGS